MMIVGCESSGVVREAFRRRGVDAWSCDLQPADDRSPYHFQCDLRLLFQFVMPKMLIVHPDCTFLTSSGLHWNSRVPGRAQKTEDALEFVRWLMALPIPHIALENPKGCIGTRIRPADQYIQPHQFGEDASKLTGLWLKALPPLKIWPHQYFPPRLVCDACGICFAYGLHKCPACSSERYKPRWGNQTNSGQNKLPPSDDRWKIRSKTYDGIAEAFAINWGRYAI